MNLPADLRLDTAPLAGLFQHTAASYKYLWMLSILQEVEQAQGQPGPVSFQRLVTRMLELARPPLLTYRLSFGGSDSMHEYLPGPYQRTPAGLYQQTPAGPYQQTLTGRHAVEDAADIPGAVVRKLLRYVPEMLLTSFFPAADFPKRNYHKKMQLIRALARQRFADDQPPLYRFDHRRTGIELHPLWAAYLWRNHAVVQGWALHHWALFLQARNPNTPGIVNKLAEPDRHLPLTEQRKWWQQVMRGQPVHCIYSGAPLKASGAFELDHYIPRSYIGHDQIWNLIPVVPEVNSSKSDRLPHGDYTQQVIELHSRVLHANAARLRSHRKIAEDYTLGLGLELELGLGLALPSVPTGEQIAQAYRRVITPLLSLAAHQGFKPNWRYRARGAPEAKTADSVR